MALDASSLAIVLGGAALAGFVQGISGFAFAMIALSVWAWALPPETAAQLSVFGALCGQLVSFLQVRKGYDLGRIAPLIVGGVFGVPLGVFLLHNIDPVRFRLVIGALLALYGAYGLTAGGGLALTHGGRLLDAFIGLIGGVLGGLGGMSGAVPAMWTQLRGWRRDLRRATMQVYNVAMHVVTLTLYARTGALDAHALNLFAMLAPAMIIPGYFGARLFHSFSEKAFSRLILGLLLLSGIAMLYGSLKTIWR